MADIFKSPDFKNIATRTDRVAFQFSMSGTIQSGVSYVNMDVAPGADLMEVAKAAGQKACKRAGATQATLHAIVNPTR